MLTAHAMTPESLRESARLGASAFLPKEKMVELEPFLEDVIEKKGKPVWKKLFERLGSYFCTRFGWSDDEAEHFLKDIENIAKDY
jgi:hypothetical protein